MGSTAQAKAMTNNERALRNHVNRLQQQNALLVECLAEERRMRQAAWSIYWNRIHGGFLNRIQQIADLMISQSLAKKCFESETRSKALLSN